MTKLHIHTPVEIDINIDDYLPHASINAILGDIKRRFGESIFMHKSNFIQLVDAIIEMRFDRAFELMNEASPHLVNIEDCRQRHLDYLTCNVTEESHKEADHELA